jgi:TnpA family transposase
MSGLWGSTSAAASWGHINLFYEFSILQSYGRGGEIALNNRKDQEKAILALHLLQIYVVYKVYIEQNPRLGHF